MAKTDTTHEGSTPTPAANETVPSLVTPAEFAKIPLDFIIATPLLTTIEAHKVAALTTLNFIENIKDKYATFKVVIQETDTESVTKEAGTEGENSGVTKEITVPLLAIVKIPSLTFDSLSVSFTYNISQIYTQKEGSSQNAELKAATKGVLSKFLDASLVGSIEHSRSTENVVNRGGSLEVKLHISETQIPAGLGKIIDAMVENIELPIKKS